MSLAGLGAVAIWHDLLPDAKDNFYEWHTSELSVYQLEYSRCKAPWAAG